MRHGADRVAWFVPRSRTVFIKATEETVHPENPWRLGCAVAEDLQVTAPVTSEQISASRGGLV